VSEGSTATADSEVPTEMEPSDIHDILRNDRRRLTIKNLQERAEGTMGVRELSEAIAALETGEDPPPSDKRQSVYVSLHQTHLPKLEEFGIVSYDSDEKTVCLEERVREVEVYMEVVPRYGLSWGEFYFGLGLLGTLTTIAVLLGVPGIEALGVTVTATVFFVILMLSATYHVYAQQDRILFQRFRKE
jgi:hypothetical protein